MKEKGVLLMANKHLFVNKAFDEEERRKTCSKSRPLIGTSPSSKAFDGDMHGLSSNAQKEHTRRQALSSLI